MPSWVRSTCGCAVPWPLRDDQLGPRSRRRGWWTRYKDVFTCSYVALESETASIRSTAIWSRVPANLVVRAGGHHRDGSMV
jgi:hypothetical protein